MKFKDHPLSTREVQIKYLIDYIPLSAPVPQDDLSKKIIPFKNGEQEPLKFFYDIIEKKLKQRQQFVVCNVPSSNSAWPWPPIRQLAYELRRDKELIMGEHILIRKYTVPSQHSGSKRLTIDQHYTSLEILKSFSNVVNGAHILLFDDIITTGNSFKGCIKHFLEHGARKITGVILGKTKKWQ